MWPFWLGCVLTWYHINTLSWQSKIMNGPFEILYPVWQQIFICIKSKIVVFSGFIRSRLEYERDNSVICLLEVVYICLTWLCYRDHLYSTMGICVSSQLETYGKYKYLDYAHLWNIWTCLRDDPWTMHETWHASPSTRCCIPYMDIFLGIYLRFYSVTVWSLSMGLHTLWRRFHGTHYLGICSTLVFTIFAHWSACASIY